MGARTAPAAFGVRTVLALVLFGAIAFLATLYFIGTGQTSRGPNDGGSHAAAKGLTGYAAIAGILEDEGYEVSLSRNRGALDDEGLLVLTPPIFADGEDIAEVIEQRRYIGPTLLILPKWAAFEIPDSVPVEHEDGWVFLGGAGKPRWVEDFDGAYTMKLEHGELDEERVADWQWGDRRGKLPDREHVTTIAEGSVAPLVTASNGGILVGYLDDGGYYPVLDEAAGIASADPDSLDSSRWNLMVVADPDLFDNYGMADRRRAELAIQLVELVTEGEDLPVTFDLTLNGLGKTQNLLTLAFTPPFLAATLCLIIAMLVVGWRAFRRFGPPYAEARAIAFGKRRLVANSAAFILRTRRLHLLTGPYIETMRQRIASTLRLRRSDDEALDQAIARRAPDAPSFSSTAARLRGAKGAHEILRAASALKSLERKLIR